MNKRTLKIAERIRKEIKSIDPTAKVILFGSRARGDARKDSDWDILILIKDIVTTEIEKSFRNKLFELELETGEVISTFVYNINTWNKKHKITPFYKSIKQEGVLL
jgi:predicted nucleotidyltransferase